MDSDKRKEQESYVADKRKKLEDIERYCVEYIEQNKIYARSKGVQTAIEKLEDILAICRGELHSEQQTTIKTVWVSNSKS